MTEETDDKRSWLPADDCDFDAFELLETLQGATLETDQPFMFARVRGTDGHDRKIVRITVEQNGGAPELVLHLDR